MSIARKRMPAALSAGTMSASASRFLTRIAARSFAPRTSSTTLSAIATIVLPGVGPILAAGLFGAIFGGAIAGTAVGGILGAMIGLGVSQEEAEYYEKQFQEGKAIVAVRTDDRGDQALRILLARGGYNLHVTPQSPIPTEGILSEP